MTPNEYNELAEKSIHKTYKKTTDNEVNKINNEAKEIADEFELANRIEASAQRESFITVKDHKPNFANVPTCRLINPCKSELGKASKIIMERIVKQVVEVTNVNLWRNTNAVLKWFNNIPNKHETMFICFDIIEFYPSITEKLLNDALDFASQYTEIISPLDRKTIIHTKKTLLFHQNQPWVKKDKPFDVAMGSYDGAECCELIVIYLLSQLKQNYGNAIGLYRDDRLAAFNEPPNVVQRIKKNICEIFKSNGLRITIEANNKVVSYLDVTLDLNHGTHKQFKQFKQRYGNHQQSFKKETYKNQTELSKHVLDTKWQKKTEFQFNGKF